MDRGNADSGCVQDVVRADSSQEINSSFDLKGKTVALGDSAFPNIPWIVHFLYLEGRMTRVLKQKEELLVRQGFDLIGKCCVVSIKGLGGQNSHQELPSSPLPFLPEVFDQFLSGGEWT